MAFDKARLIQTLKIELDRQGQEVRAMSTYKTWPEDTTLGVDGAVELGELAQAIIDDEIPEPCSRCAIADELLKALDYAQAAPNTNGLMSIDDSESEGREQDRRWKLFREVRERYNAHKKN